jgi:hypothetical protein
MYKISKNSAKLKIIQVMLKIGTMVVTFESVQVTLQNIMDH